MPPRAAAMSDWVSFKTNLENALLTEADLTSNAIMSLAMSIHENNDYGAQCLTKLKRTNAAANKPKISERELEILAKQMIREDINKQRQEWAYKWFYYGNDPGPNAHIIDTMELQQWALWILAEKLELYTYEVRDNQDDVLLYTSTGSKGVTFGDLGVPDLVLRRLADFGVVEVRTSLQKLSTIAARGAKEQLEAARKLREQKEDQEATAAYQKAIEAAEGAEDPAKERAAVMRQKYEQDRKVRERRAQEKPKQDEPPITVGSVLDTQAEIDALNGWARRYQPPPTALPSGLKRTLPSIENVHKR
jgi:hypothetical protein